MTNKELLLDVFTDIADEYIDDVETRIKSVKARRTVMWLSVAALFVILVTSITPLLTLRPQTPVTPDGYTDKDNTSEPDDSKENDASGWFGSSVGVGGCSNYGMVGVAKGEYFYFEVPDDGIYRYTPTNGYSEKIVDIKFSDEWYKFVVNDYALYYQSDDNTIKRITHDSNTAEVFYTDDSIDCLTIYSYTSTDIQVSVSYNNYMCSKDIIVDGVTGEEKEILYSFDISNYEEIYNELAKDYPDFPSRSIEEMMYDKMSYMTDEVSHTIGSRTLTLKSADSGGFILTENGERIIDNRVSGEAPVKATEDYLIFSLGTGGTTIDPTYHYYIARANGEDTRVISSFAHSPEGNSKFFYYIDREGNLTCHDVINNEKIILLSNENLAYCDLYADEDYIYICRYNSETRAQKLKTLPVCYEVMYDSNGKPFKLKLLDDNIVK